MAKKQRGSPVYNIRIPEDLESQMLAQCKKLGITPSALIKEALKKYLNDLAEQKVRYAKQ